jgi:membrane dipeptidase
MSCCFGPRTAAGAPPPVAAAFAVGETLPVAAALALGETLPTGSPRTASVVDRERVMRMARRQTWMDAHAHPGRCFLMGLAPDDPWVRAFGVPDPGRAIDDLVAGAVRLCAFATVADLRVLGLTADGIRSTREFAPGEAAADHRRQLDALASLEHEPRCRVVRRAADLHDVPPGSLGMVFTCEGADFLEGRLDGLGEVYAAGARSITLVHYRINELGDIQTEAPRHGGLSRFGAEVVREMNRLGMVIDLAHATWEVTRDVLDRSDAPVMISHSHLARGRDSHPRLLREEHALAVAKAGGLVAAWPAGVALATFEDFVDEILRMVDLLGVDHVALGTDMDANYRPVMTSHLQVADLAAALLDRGVGEAEVGLLLGGNLVRLFSRVLG